MQNLHIALHRVLFLFVSTVCRQERHLPTGLDFYPVVNEKTTHGMLDEAPDEASGSETDTRLSKAHVRQHSLAKVGKGHLEPYSSDGKRGKTEVHGGDPESGSCEATGSSREKSGKRSCHSHPIRRQTRSVTVSACHVVILFRVVDVVDSICMLIV